MITKWRTTKKMNNVFKSIFLYVANKFGLDLVQQIEQENDFFETEKMSVTAPISERVATITLMGSTIKVDGTSARAELIQECATNLYQNHLKSACTFALGTGSALIKPNTNGDRFGFDIIPEQNYRITGYIGDYIYSMLIVVGEYQTNNHTYTLVERQEIKKDADGISYIEIDYSAFRDDKPCNLSETRWSDRETHRIANVDHLLLGRIKCPVTNRKDVNSPNGVPITFGQNEITGNIKGSYRQYNTEREDKETMIFADKSLMKKDEKTGRTTIPKGKDRLFMLVHGRNLDDKTMDVFSPEIRETPLDNAIERNYRTLELSIGLGEGILSKSNLTYKNMDEVRASKSSTYAFMSALRNQIDSCIEDVLRAIDVIANYNNITPMGEYEAHIEWSDEYMTSVSERFNQMLQAETAGWIDAAEGRSVLMNEDIDESREAIEKIESKKPKQIDAMFGGAE